MKQYTHIFFDLDRTLWDLETNAHRTLLDLYHKYLLSNYFTSPDEFVARYTVINKNLWAEYTRGNINKEKLRKSRFHQTLKGNKCTNFDLAVQLDKDYVSNCPQQTALLPNCIEMLQYLASKQYRMSIITNGFADSQQRKLSNSQIASFFNRIYDSETVGFPKPSAKLFQYVLNNEKVHANNALMIGDDWEADIDGAAKMGIDQVYISPNGVFDGPASYQIKNLAEVMSIL